MMRRVGRQLEGWLWIGAVVGVAPFLLGMMGHVANAALPQVMINEIMWDGTEYVELYNPGTEAVALEGWQLVRQQSAEAAAVVIVTFPDDAEVPAEGFWLIEKNETATTVPADTVVGGLTLLNAGEQVQLLDASGVVIDTANRFGAWWAGENTSDGVAMERVEGTDDGALVVAWQTSVGLIGERAGTPRAANSVLPDNTAPEAVVTGPVVGLVGQVLTFSADDATDAEGDELIYTWSFGDGGAASGVSATHSFAAAGTYTVRISVSDGELEDEAQLAVTVTAPVYTRALVINEVLPNPAGDDTTTEFIELLNTSGTTVDLGGWQLDDADGGSASYTIPAGKSIAGSSFVVFTRAETKIALNNTGDSVRLLDPNGEVAATFSYASAVPDGQSYSRTTSGSVVLSTTVTQGTTNVITVVTEDESEEAEDDESEEVASTGTVAGVTVKQVELAEVRDEEVGTVITTEGVVSAPPGILAKQIMYLAGSGIQVYFSKATWPTLKLGDRVAVTGELASVRGEARLKLAAVTDVMVAAAGAPPEPHVVTTEEVDEALEGSLVTIQGRVTETSGDTFYVDDGSGAVKVYIAAATKIDKPPMKRDMAVTITGIVSETDSGYRLLPRWQEDIRMGLVAGLTSFPATGWAGWEDAWRMLVDRFMVSPLLSRA